VTQLRQKMLEELQRRNYSHRTAKTYVRIVREFATYFHQPPDKLGPEQIRQYQAHLFQAKKLAPATVSQYVSALRFLFVKTLRRHFLAEYIPFPKSRKRLPTVLSPEEVTRLIDAACNLYHRTLLMTLYSTAVRRAELCRLKVQDIDSQRMMELRFYVSNKRAAFPVRSAERRIQVQNKSPSDCIRYQQHESSCPVFGTRLPSARRAAG
jgi:integrase/recombinase XerD